ncbi:MAG TPA: PIG-L family deacetylase [Acidimicrobiia bacterium]|nr:PIG-L family deacetylase [Acidimicrobiia bacterium]
MPGLMAFHAHPDDEVIQTGGVLSKAVDAGEHVVVVTATDGAEGEVHNYDDPDPIKSRLAEVRAEEVRASLDILGVEHHAFLGYRDSGMMGEESNKHPECFWQADFMDATARLVRQIRRHRPDVLVIYDPYGGYGHPDHINVHRIGLAAYTGCIDLGRFPLEQGEELWEPKKLYWTTWPRSRVKRMMQARFEAGEITEEELAQAENRGTPDEYITCWVDVADKVGVKEQALRAHRSQIPADWPWLTMADDQKVLAFGRESFVRVFTRVEAPEREDDLFAGLR